MGAAEAPGIPCTLSLIREGEAELGRDAPRECEIVSSFFLHPILRDARLRRALRMRENARRKAKPGGARHARAGRAIARPSRMAQTEPGVSGRCFASPGEP